jgi:hypothetical protein
MNQLVWMLVEGMRQSYTTVAHEMTVGEIAHGLLYLELKEAGRPKEAAHER